MLELRRNDNPWRRASRARLANKACRLWSSGFDERAVDLYAEARSPTSTHSLKSQPKQTTTTFTTNTLPSTFSFTTGEYTTSSVHHRILISST